MYSNKAITNSDIFSGEIVAAQFLGDWSRAEVKRVHSSIYEVLYIDYGNTAMVPDTEIAPLKNELLELPICAITCALDGVSGIAQRQIWDSDFCEASKLYKVKVTFLHRLRKHT